MLVKATDSELVNNIRAFPCKAEDHQTYNRIRYLLLEIQDCINMLE